MKEGEGERGQKEIKENDGESRRSKQNLRVKKGRIERHEAEKETAGREGIWNLCDGIK